MSIIKDYGQLFCEAVDTIVKERLSNINYDTTVLGTIVEDKDKAQGEYIVLYGEAKFTAYALNSDKYSKDDRVYVQIPNNDWNERKFITAKKTSDENIPIHYQYPFDSYVDISGNIIQESANLVKGSLIANGDFDEEGNIIQPTSSSKIIWTKSNSEEYSGYTRLGIQAQFQSWLAEDFAVSGSYGLRLRVKATKDAVEEGQEGDAAIEYYDFLLDSSDMIGNPYTFNSYFQQEKVFNIADIHNISQMELQFYQKGDFYNVDGQLIESTDPNLFIKDVYISFGYDANELDGDSLYIYSFDSNKYDTLADPEDLNHKQIHLRWIYKDPKTGESKSIIEDDQKDYKLIWYRFKLGAEAHSAYSGADWALLSDQIYNTKNKKYETNIYDEDWLLYNKSGGYVVKDNSFGKTVVFSTDIETDTDEEGNVIVKTAQEQKYPSYNSTWLFPDITMADEAIKAVLIYEENDETKYLVSNTLIFTNKQEVVNKLALEAVTALSIECRDGSNGNYRIYGQGNQLLNNADSQVKRTFIALFKNSELANAESIEWIIPENSMITIREEDKSNDTFTKEGFIHIKRYGDELNKYDILYNNSQSYYINNYLTQSRLNNTITCIVVRNKITYITTIDLVFGAAGTSGTNYTLVLNFDNNIQGIPCTNGVAVEDIPDTDIWKELLQDQFTISAKLYDFENNEIPFAAADTITWEFSLIPTGLDENEVGLTAMADDEEKAVCIITPDYTKLNMDQLFILQASFKRSGLEGSELPTLIAYLPIPLYSYGFTKEEPQPSHIQGATEVLYLSNGNVVYPKIPYQLFYRNSNAIETDVSVFPKVGDSYFPEIQNGVLKPIGFYIKNAQPYAVQFKNTGGQIVWTQPIITVYNRYPNPMVNDWDGKTLEMDDQSGSILSTAIAAGRKEADNTFSGVMLGDWKSANKKNEPEDDVVGDTSIEESLTLTGVYGFHKGGMSYAFKEDGTAFIGQAGKGRILFDGTSGGIYSSDWHLTDQTKQQGLFLDMDDGILKIQRQAGYLPVSKDNSNTGDFNSYYIYYGYTKIELDGGVTHPKDDITYYTRFGESDIYNEYSGDFTEEQIPDLYIFENKYEKATGSYNENTQYYVIDTSDRYITLSTTEQTYPLSIGSNKYVSERTFKVDWNGKVYIRNGDIQGEITANSGSIGGWFIFDGYMLSNNGATILNSSDGLITTERFKVALGNREYGYMGMLTGSDGITITENLGLRSVGTHSIRLDSDNDIGLLSLGSGIYLQALKGSDKDGQVSLSGTDIVLNATTLIKNESGNLEELNKIPNGMIKLIGGELQCNIPAENQTGIYARFA